MAARAAHLQFQQPTVAGIHAREGVSQPAARIDIQPRSHVVEVALIPRPEVLRLVEQLDLRREECDTLRAGSNCRY
jgi:hypothetical protein